ncbi:MAG TPA: filamentous hemagglutinin N-terminal domain-containing protein [Candidatus Kapabacteria bacterium]|nr:filamentous hemagglutinin N-terminal domain-containing protein [Candidatus Kapabacteria bacterium]
MLALNCGMTALLPAASLAQPSGGVVASGDGTITSGPVTSVQQNSEHLALNWGSFNIQPGEQVIFVQPGTSSVALNRDFSGIPSELFGSLQANGQVFLLNTAGVLIGPSATINVGGLLVSDLSLSDDEFARLQAENQMTLTETNPATGGIVNQGSVTSSTRNGITLIGQYIDNAGTLTANNGNINLAIADGPIVVTDSSGMLGVQLSQGLGQNLAPSGALLNNSGEIRAVQGNIAINIRYQSGLNVQAVNNTGLVNAVGIGYGNIDQNIVLEPAPVDPGDQSDAVDIISDSFVKETDDSSKGLAGDAPRKPATNVDELISSCNEDENDSNECKKQNAIKRYLGRLLIGGSLPD